MDRIQINNSKAKATSNLYKNIIDELDTITNDLKKSIDDIPSAWKGKASDTFSMDHFPKIYIEMQKQITMLKIIKDEIYLAADDFEELERELISKF